jgi:sulfite reductase alpha subunit
VSEIKSAAAWNESSKDLLGVLEKSYREKIGHWKHGGIVGVMGYGGGVIGRYSTFLRTSPIVATSTRCASTSPPAGSTPPTMLRKDCATSGRSAAPA